MELATAVAEADPSPQVSVEVIEALQFRRSELPRIAKKRISLRGANS
jgi:hypothetical protein